jgi:hypothetical protein
MSETLKSYREKASGRPQETRSDQAGSCECNLGCALTGVECFPRWRAAVQWHPDLSVQPSLGPASVPLSDYVAAQTYAAALIAALIAEHCLQPDTNDPLTAATKPSSCHLLRRPGGNRNQSTTTRSDGSGSSPRSTYNDAPSG